jgi:hypothetical protein
MMKQCFVLLFSLILFSNPRSGQPRGRLERLKSGTRMRAMKDLGWVSNL